MSELLRGLPRLSPYTYPGAKREDPQKALSAPSTVTAPWSWRHRLSDPFGGGDAAQERWPAGERGVGVN